MLSSGPYRSPWVSMRFQDLRAALEPTLGNVDALYAKFMSEHNSTNLQKFVEHLRSQGLIDDDALRAIADRDPSLSGTLAGGRSTTTKADVTGMQKKVVTPVLAKTTIQEPGDPGYSPPVPPEAPRKSPVLAKTAFSEPEDPAPGRASQVKPILAKTAYLDPDEAEKSLAATPAPAPGRSTTSAATPPPAPPPNIRTANPAPGRTTAPVPAAKDPGRSTGSSQTSKARPSTGKSLSPGAAQPLSTSAIPSGMGFGAGGGPEAHSKSHSRTPSMPPKGAGVPGAKESVTNDLPGRGYKFTGKIGEGAMGEVLIAKDLDLHRTVAYKVMSEAIVAQPHLSGKFYGEAQITAQLDHPSIVPVYALARAPNGTLSYTMKLIRGRTFEKYCDELKEMYKARKRIPEDMNLNARLDMFIKVCDAMYYAHTRGVVHRDLKPENVMVGAFGEVYVMDWGIARLFDVAGVDRDDLVLVEGYQDEEQPAGAAGDDGDDDDVEGVIIGTPAYMSPEQAFGKKDLDGKSDQYSLGLILYELVALKQAVTGKSPQKLVMRQQDAEKDPFTHAFGESIPTEIKAIVAKATMKNPAHRYANVHDLAEDLKRFMRGDAVLAKPDTIIQATLRWVGRHREITLFALFVLFSMAGFTAFSSVGFTIIASARASAHEQALTQLLTATNAQAAKVDSAFARFEGQLGIVAASSVEMLLRGEPTTDTIYTDVEYDTAGAVPPDTAESKHYKRPISVQYPVYVLAPNVDREKVTAEMAKLTPVQRYLKRVLLLSHSDEAAARTPKAAERMISDVGVPIAWAGIGLSDGVYVGYPGHGGFPKGYDARERPWYKLALDKHEPVWGSPFIDASGMGLMLPCAIGLFDEDNKFFGVASVRLPFDYIINDLLVTKGLPSDAEALLVDEQGQMVVRSSEKGKTFDDKTLRNRGVRLEMFPIPEVVERIKQHESGQTYAPNGDLVLFNRMSTLGWYYVVQGPEDSLLENATAAPE